MKRPAWLGRLARLPYPQQCVGGDQGLTQSAKARGFRSRYHPITVVNLIGGKLDFELPDLGCAAYGE